MHGLTKQVRNWSIGAIGMLTLGAAPSQAAFIELGLVVDASGSINTTEWEAQIQGYSNAINNVVPTDGSVAISVTRFAETASLVRAMTTISNEADRDALSDFFWDSGSGLSQSGNGSLTCISCGITTAHASFTGNADRSIIDVSTDGESNRGPNPAGDESIEGTSAWAVANDADVVNTIGIGTSSDPDFNSGPGSFSLLAEDFEDFESVLTRKLQLETTPTAVPAPMPLVLMGIGLAGMGLVARRSAATAAA